MEEPRLERPLVDRVLARLGLASAPPVDRRGLEDLYRAWCRTVPWDNVQKRVSVKNGRVPLAGAYPDEFFENLLRDGTGGTCWPSSGALHALLLALGFDARRVAGTMSPDRWPGQINHASAIVTIDDEELLVDSSMLTERPIPLRSDAETVIDDPVHPVQARPTGDLWTIRWRIQARDEEIDCVLVEDDAPFERYLECYEESRVSGFSYFLTLTKNIAGGILSLNGSKRTFRDGDGRLMAAYVEDRGQVLISEAGLSPRIVAALPPDEPDPNHPRSEPREARSDAGEKGGAATVRSPR
jgi:N-hydroxyarylamine O-acetyltransferase